MVCTASFPCHIKKAYIEGNRDGALYKGEFCVGCSWWKDKEPEPTPCPDSLERGNEYLASHSAEEILSEADELKPNKPPDCPGPLCILDLKTPAVCQNCPRKPKLHRGWGGKRAGTGAPLGNLNRLIHGRQSKFLRRAVEKLAADPEMRVFLILVTRITTEGALPETTRKLIRKYAESPQVKGGRLFRKVRQHHA